LPSSNIVSDVITRAQSNLNDTGAQIWNLPSLLGHLRNAYAWMYNEIMKACDATFEKVSADLVYTPPLAAAANQEQDLGPNGLAIIPADLYQPISVEFRLNTTEEWVPLNRVSRLSSRVSQPTARVYDWEWRNRTIFVWPSTQAGLIRIRYQLLLPILTAGGDSILMDNILEALAYYTAADAYRRRGQHTQATAMMGSEVPPTGAIGFMSQIVTQCVLNDQTISRRGQRFSQGSSGANDSRFSG
jgi:hypothetical protein